VNEQRRYKKNHKWKDGDKPVAAITKKGMNKIICEKCHLELTGDNDEQIS